MEEAALENTKKTMKIKKMIIMINVLMTTPLGITEVILVVNIMTYSQPLVDFMTMMILRLMKLAVSVAVDLPEEVLEDLKEEREEDSFTDQEVLFLCLLSLLLEEYHNLLKLEKI